MPSFAAVLKLESGKVTVKNDIEATSKAKAKSTIKAMIADTTKILDVRLNDEGTVFTLAQWEAEQNASEA